MLLSYKECLTKRASLLEVLNNGCWKNSVTLV